MRKESYVPFLCRAAAALSTRVHPVNSQPFDFYFAGTNVICRVRAFGAISVIEIFVCVCDFGGVWGRFVCLLEL